MISLKFNLTSFACVSSPGEALEPAGPPEKQSQLETEPKVRCLTRNALSRNKEIEISSLIESLETEPK